MQSVNFDVAIVGAGGGGLRAAIAAAEANPNLKIALISKVYPMRSHTVAAEGGSAAVIKDNDSFDNHFNDTVGGGDWLCEQDIVEYFVEHSPIEMTQLERWGCPWSRREDGEVNVRRFGGMKIERTWFAADKTGFHILHTLFQTSMKYPNIVRFDEHFVLDILTDNGEARGCVAMNMMEGTLVQINASAVVIATGNDFRAVEASVHAYASKSGKYSSLSHCTIENGIFRFWIELPISVGVVGGLTSLHPLVKFSLALLGKPNAKELMGILAVSGLAQNFAALRSLVTTGIQKGHMKMHLFNILNQLGANEEEKKQISAAMQGKTLSYSGIALELEKLRKQK